MYIYKANNLHNLLKEKTMILFQWDIFPFEKTACVSK